MLKSILAERGISVYRLSKDSGIPYSTLEDLVSCKLPIENMRCGQVHALAKALDMEMDALYRICSFSPSILSEKYNVTAVIQVKHKHYWLSFQRNGKVHEAEIAATGKDAFAYLDTLARWKLDEELAKLELEEAYEAILAKTV